MMREPVLIVCLLALALGPNHAQAEPDAPRSIPALRFRLDAIADYYGGDYGTDSTTRVAQIAVRFRWELPRAEFRASLPLVHVSNEGSVVIIGGQPVPTNPGRSGTAGPPRPGGPGPPGSGGAGGASPGAPDRSATGPGDIQLQGEYFFLTGTRRRPWLTGLLRVDLPTGDEQKGLGSGELNVRAGLGLIQPVGRSYFFADGSYTWMGDPPGFDLENVVALGAGWSWQVGARPGRAVFVFVENRTNPVPGEEDRADATLGGSMRLGKQGQGRFSLSGSYGLTETTPDFGVTLLLGGYF